MDVTRIVRILEVTSSGLSWSENNADKKPKVTETRTVTRIFIEEDQLGRLIVAITRGVIKPMIRLRADRLSIF
jgi:hypothetical protein